MNKQGLNQYILIGCLAKVLKEIKELFNKSTFETTIRHTKRIARLLVYHLKYRKLILSSAKVEYENYLQQCFKMLVCFVDSSEFKKFRHIFPFYSYITKIFHFRVGKITQDNELEEYHESILKRREKNQASFLYKSIKNWFIQGQELNFLKNHRCEDLIDSLESKKVNFSNPFCVCCSQVFTKGADVFNQNPIFNTLLGIPTLDYASLEKLLNCIATSNGGVILIGAKKVGNILKLVGLQFNTLSEVSEAQKMIRSSIMKIRPQCNFFIQKVPVQNHIFQSEDLEPKHVGLCFRVLIFPRHHHKITYLAFSSKNKLEYYETYQLDSDQNPVEIKFTQEKPSTVYTMMHRKYCKKSQSRVNSHEGIICYRPLPYNPSSQPNNGISQQNMMNNQLPQLQDQRKKVYSDQPRFKYQRVSLIVVNSAKEDQQVLKFEKFLKEMNIEFQLYRAFPDTFKCKPGDRSVWIMSHNTTFFNLCKTISKAQKEGPKIRPVIKVMTVQKTLQVKESKFSAYNEKIVEKRFKDRYPEGFFVEEAEQQKFYFLTFPNLEQSIYAFMVMQELNLKPQFPKHEKK